MFEIETIIMFTTASLLLALAPGPDNIFVLTQSIVHGRKAGIIITLGLCTGLIFHTAIVVLGIAAIFQTSLTAFNTLKFIGAAYLLYLAYQAFISKEKVEQNQETPELKSAHLYRTGIIMNVTNPKVSIFFLAFLPQFTKVNNGAMPVQIILLGAIFILCTFFVFSIISQISGAIGKVLYKSDKLSGVLNKVAGTVFAALAVKLIFTQR
ncbi:MAG: LysE family translocator [Ignavibacteriae bacterium]|nr:LysE family translocator [Ignavibacteriota bacterium]NOG97837.1 LysE family translocator [Ignavibacteriota bacterium]